MKQRLFPYLPYMFLTLLIMAPLLAQGYILTLDMIFVPHPPLPSELSSSYLFRVALHFLSFIIPSDILQKIMLCSIIFFGGLGFHLLIEHIKPKEQSTLWSHAAYVAGLLYVINPFTYARFMAGHYSVLLGYALLPWLLRSFLRFIHNPTPRSSTPVILWMTIISIVSIHTAGIVMLLIIVALLVTIWRHSAQRSYLVNLGKSSLYIVVSLLVMSSYWLITTLAGHGPIADASHNIEATQSGAFATTGGLLNILQLHGFWAESTSFFVHTTQPLPLSGLWQLALFGLVITGIIQAWRHHQAIAITLLVSSTLAIILALGIFQDTLTNFLPIFGGYREPHKFVMILALSNAYFAAWGAYFIIKKLQKYRTARAGALTILMLLPLLITPTMIWGFYGQLRPVDYPRDWYTIESRLSQQKNDGKVLFLPWHLYMRFGFAHNRVIATPADTFFTSKQVITSDNPELGTTAPLSPNPLKQTISELLKKRAINTEKLGKQGIGYILIAKESDYQAYGYIEKLPGLTLVSHTPTLKLYRIGE